MLLGDGHNRIHIRRLAVKVHGYDGTGVRRDGGGNAPRIEIERFRVGFDWNGYSTSKGDGQPGGDGRVRRHDDFVAWTDFQSAQSEMQGIQAGADADAMFRATICSVFLLEGFKFATKQIPTRIHDPIPGSIKLILEFKIGRFEFQKRNSHGWTSAAFLNSV